MFLVGSRYRINFMFIVLYCRWGGEIFTGYVCWGVESRFFFFFVMGSFMVSSWCIYRKDFR